MPTLTARDLLIQGFDAIFTPWQVETLDAVLVGLRYRGLTPTALRGFKGTRGATAHITYYTDVADPARATSRHMQVILGA